jgi:DNA-binding transcriptional MerR regulator
MANYSIQHLSKTYDVTPRTIRFYEDKGIISPTRQGVTRVFSERDKVRLELALRGRRLGFSVEEIVEIIDMYDPEQPGDPQQLLYLCQKIREHRKLLINKINDIAYTLNLMDEVERKAFENLASQQKNAPSEISTLN